MNIHAKEKNDEKEIILKFKYNTHSEAAVMCFFKGITTVVQSPNVPE